MDSVNSDVSGRMLQPKSPDASHNFDVLTSYKNCRTFESRDASQNFDDDPTPPVYVLISYIQLIINKQLQRNSKVSMRKIAHETGMSKSSVHRIARKNPKYFNSSRMRTSAYGWGDSANASIGPLISNGSKSYSRTECYSPPSKRTTTKTRAGPLRSAIDEHRQNPQSIMIWAGIFASGKTLLCELVCDRKLSILDWEI
ncbi:hypothetical protein LAZ67_19002625 [Cordylochernes scorpioides]|uniref:HTH iclR-type domain-containing protein n=1 Tax=Cordylochernes scorpioides TaxID=51811 RepID=A0ABY6LLJ0_9ARAC|nr:hypothetical protein LAZ67_19002625 [Cordylochernes scorpioides]